GTAGGAGPRRRALRFVPRAAARPRGRHRARPLRPGAHGLPVVRLQGRVRAAAALAAAAAAQAGRRAREAGAAPEGRAVSFTPVDHEARRRAREDHATSFVLEAGAGT